ncbi:MAG: CinA family protein [Candidatus Nanopelagicales bacterium]|nr:CinA family protein [Candidatus Nanopelagicales bacterium]MDZ4249555.1 CinA family protein [Candidatus Nanopelagicales bacterium]
MSAEEHCAASDVIELLRSREWSVATAESLTGGLVCAALTAVAGASDCVNGGVVAYCPSAKSDLLGVSRRVLEARGPVDPAVAVQMARGAARVLHADLAISTTGVAGPDPHGGAGPGTVYVGWWTAQASGAKRWDLKGDRAAIQKQTVDLALDVMCDLAGGSASSRSKRT